MTHFRLLAVCALVLAVSGCANFGYYAQAFRGQIDIMAKSRAIDDIIEDRDTDPLLRKKLTKVLEIRDFASHELGLPKNRSYRAYADLKRPYVAWNVFATPELSLEPKEWCFMVTGCVTYRGYFDRAQAEAFAARLREQGYDVHVAGVAAYSTLGWFHDPMLNTILNRAEPDLAGLIFHELAHQQLYVPGDTAFNESFAMTVELEGVRRWVEQRLSPEDYTRYQERFRRREEFVGLVLRHRERLASLYRSDAPTEEKRAAKHEIFAELRREYAMMKERWNGYAGFDGWFAQPLNNAHVLSIGTYHQHVPAFQALLARHRGDLQAFFQAAADLGRMPSRDRIARLNTYLPTAILEDGARPL